MQSTQASLKRPLNGHDIPLGASKILEGSEVKSSPLSSRNKQFIGRYKPRTVSFSKESFPSVPPQNTFKNQTVLLDEDYAKAGNCLSRVDDPLWKHVCGDVFHMMGPASLLKIWDSTLGEVCSQEQSVELYCKTEESTQFIQQYDFVILGSLKQYFPALKQLRVKTISTL